ncbi:MAG: DHA2 family efflux MFS transporter permease subunit [Alphaproteobacteria bacterium]
MTDIAEPRTAVLGAARRWLALAAAMTGSAVYMLSLTISATAIPHMQGAFSAAPDQISWMLTSFIIGTTITTACSGWIASRYGRKRVFVFACGGFTVMSILCGLATSLGQEVLFRTLQGLIGAPLLPLSQAIAIDTFPPEKRGLAISLQGFGAVSGAVIGPYVGGVLVEAYGWPWVFFVYVPLGALAFVASWAFVPEIERDPGRTLSWTGFGLFIVAIATFQLMLNRGERLDWFASSEVIAEAAVAGIAFYAFVLHTAAAREPFFAPQLFRDRNYLIGLFLVFVFGALIFLQMFLVPVLLLEFVGFTMKDVGYVLGWRALGLMASTLAIGPVVDRLDPRLTFVGGFLFMAASAWVMSQWTLEIRPGDVAWANFLQGICSGVAYIPIAVMAFSTLPERLRNDGVALFFLMSNLGTATGTAAIFNFLTRSMRVNRSVITEHLTLYNELFRSGGVPRLWDLHTTGGLAAMDAEVVRQAAIIAYTNSFYLIALVTLAVLPLALFVRLPKRTPAS